MPRYSFHIFFFFLFLASSTGLLAQEVNVRLEVRDEKKQAVPAATIKLVLQADTSKVQYLVADTSGALQVKLNEKSIYELSVSASGFGEIVRTIYPARQQHYLITISNQSRTLTGVVVRSSRPLMRQEDDKTIVDPENLVSSSTTGYEVMEKIPGLFVDQDGNIYISSTTPATIYVNGREMKMSNADIATMLKSLPPNAISRIEILRTPSAKYDASGSGGIVNVVLKKGVKLGLTGSINAGNQQGTYGNEFLGFNLNNNSGKVSTYVNLNISQRDNYERINTDRVFAPDSMLSQDARTRYPTWVYFAGFGANMEAGKRWQMGYDSRISYSDFDNSTRNKSIIRKISTGDTIMENPGDINNKGSNWLITQGLNARYRIDSLGSEWTSDLSYSFAHNSTDQFYSNRFNSPSFPVDYLEAGNGNNLAKRNLFSFQSDLVRKLNNGLTIETGVKTSWLWFNSVSDYNRVINAGTPEKDYSRINTFRYRENINSVYLQASKGFAGFLLKTGTRMENTNMSGHQVVPGDTTFNINRTDFFPYVYLSRKVMTIMGFDLRGYLVYRRTISRPVYEQLNPFPRYVDQYLSEVGNPALRPQFTQNMEANISVDDIPLLAIGINKTKDIFTNVIYQADTSRSQAYRTYDNLGKNREFYIRGLGAIPPGGKYFFVVGGQYNHNFYEGLYEGQPLAFKKGSWTFFTYHQLKLGKSMQATLNGFIRLKGQLQFYELSSFGALNASINRQFLKQKLVVTLSANDIFRTNRNEFVINQGSVQANGFREADTRRFGVNVRYNFGIRKKEDKTGFPNMEAPTN